MPYRIETLTAPLFETLEGTVKNLVIDSVNIASHSGNTGAIACTAQSAARVYNVGILSGSVGGTGNTGGLVGQLNGTARVVNCYSYESHNLYGATTLTGSALTAAFVHCYLVDKSQTGITLVTAANTAASSGTTGALVDILNDGTGLPTPLVSRQSWQLGSSYPVLSL